MRFIDIVRLASRIFKKNRLRTTLTILGISVAIGSIVVLVSLGYGLQRITIDRISKLSALKTLDVTVSPNSDKLLNEASLEELKRIEGVLGVNGVANLPAQIEYNEQVGDVILWSVTQNYFDLEGLAFSSGKKFENPDGVAVTSATLELFGLSTNEGLGKEILLNYYPVDKDGNQAETNKTVNLKISGIIDDEVAANIYVDSTVVGNDFGTDYPLIKVEAFNENSVPAIKDKINSIGYQATTVIDMVEQMKEGFKWVRIFFAVLGMIAIIVAAIGMFNTMTISLLERTREIGTMKALGATDADIWKIFLGEAGLISFFGGAGGVVLGMITGQIIGISFNVLAVSLGGEKVDLFYTPLSFIGAIILFALFVGVVTGIYPARRAARLNPIDALRYE